MKISNQKMGNFRFTLLKRYKYPLMVFVVVLGIICGALFIKHGSKHSTDTQTIKSTSSNTKPTANNNTESTKGTPIPNGSSNKSSVGSQGVDPSATINNPSGTFVSNHTPSLNGDLSLEQSTCITSPGANCYIKFVKDNETKYLSTLVADDSGGVVWTWNVKDAGFSAGSWQVIAVASLNGQTKTTTDQIPLKVQP